METEEKMRFLVFCATLLSAGIVYVAVRLGFMHNFIEMINQWSVIP